MTTGTLFYQEFEALDLVDASEARFLSSAVRDAVRQAQRHGQYEALLPSLSRPRLARAARLAPRHRVVAGLPR